MLSIVSIFLIFTAGLSAQEYYLKHLQVEDGLSHNSVICSLQDSHGFLWFGTKDGLNRYDGYTFKLYHSDPNQKNNIGSNFIQNLLEFDGYLWVGTDNGLYRFDQEAETFTLLEPTRNQSIHDLEYDDSGHLWFIAGSTMYRYNIESGNYKTFDTSDYFWAVSLTRGQDNTLWASSSVQIYKFDEDQSTFIPMSLRPADDTEFPFMISTIYTLNPHTLLVGTQNHGALLYDVQTGEQRPLLIHDQEEPLFVRNFAAKGSNEVWIASENGVYIYDIEKGTYDHIKKELRDNYALSDNAVYTITVDNEQGVWMGTYFRGINYYPKQYTPFRKFYPKQKVNSIGGYVVREIQKDDHGNLWIGTEDAGLQQYNFNTGQFTNYNPLKNNTKLSYYNIHGIYPDGNKLWVGNFEHGMDVMDIPSGKILRHYGMGNKGNLKSNFVFSIKRNRENKLLVLCTGGVQQYDSIQDSFVDYPPFTEHYFFNSMLEPNDEEIWMGTYRNGLLYYNKKTNTKVTYKYDSADSLSISSNAINNIFKDHSGTIWILTENGVNRYLPETGKFERFNTEDGFPTNVTYSVLEDKNFNLWITTSKGLVKFNPVEKSIRTYTTANGLLGNQFNYSSAYKDTDGTMYFGTIDGMIAFNPENFIKNTYSPPIYITGIQINNKEVNVSNAEEGTVLPVATIFLRDIELPYNESSFSIDFASLSYNAPQATEYWYMLEGLNENWIETEKDHRAYFTKVAPGNYTFKVKAMNSNGSLSYTDDLTIRIQPPFWASNMAYVLYAILVGSLIYFSLRFYHHQTEEKNNRRIKQLNNKKEKEIYQAKIEFFTNVAHEIRTPLTLIKSPLEKLLKTETRTSPIKENLMIMERNTSRMLDLVNQLLDFRKTEIEGVKLTFVRCNITSILENTYERFSHAIKEKDLHFDMSYPDSDIYAYVDAEAFKKILSNLLSNAIKYAETKIFVTLKSEDNRIIIIAKNDGELIPVDLKERVFEPFFRAPEVVHQTGTGIGLSLAHSLTELHKGKLYLDNTDAVMNTFILELPVHQEMEFELYPENGEKHAARKDELMDFEIEQPFINGEEIEFHKPTVLLVEDNEDLLDFIAKDLREDYYVLKSPTAEKALEILQNENIHLVISDVMMPGMNGFELCKKIKTSIDTSHIPVIILTSKSAIQAKVEGLESGADAYIEKPFSIEYLRLQLKNLIENRKHIMQFYSSTPLAHIRSIAHSKTDESFIKTLDKVIYENISDSNLSVEVLAEIMNMSRSTLYRKIKDISNMSPNELINITRLKRAAELLKSGDFKIYEVAEMVGYNSQTSFGRNFHKQFQMTPTEYMNS
ncbi:hybrid sensor histidine kinase/response regulator [Robertkochia solimangrovi]|nr:hybrid sensor histidine kinase/response regulator [Robertkochia solimangrovi]